MPEFKPLSPEVEKTAKEIVDAAFKVHSTMGPGLLESVYESCLEYELTKRGFKVKRQVELPIVYETVRLDAGLRIDLLVNDNVVVELKAVEKMNDIFGAQVLTYLKLTGLRLGLLINFNVSAIKNGIKRIVL
jgi:GxxExxY protein